MDRSLHTAATGMQALQTNIDVISHNLANLNTTGYKKTGAHFSSLFTQVMIAPGARLSDGTVSPNGIQIGLGVELASTAKSFSMGSLNNTGNPLDVAVEGDGFLQVQLPDGQIAYTRDGHLQVDGQTGELVTSQGFHLFPNINMGNDVESVSITANGQVTVVRAGANGQADQVGVMRLARFVNPAGLIESSDNMYKISLASGQAIQGTPMSDGLGAIRQNFLEQSNVKVVEEIVDMITAQRAYEANSNIIKASDEMLRQANSMAT